MRTILTTTLLIAITACFTLTSCERKDELAGKGGKATLKVTPQHHGDNIDSCTIFLKYNAQDLPSEYDEQLTCVLENGKPVATFSELKPGNYYIYGSGWDPDINQAVVGGIPYKIEEEKTYNITVPVTEGD